MMYTIVALLLSSLEPLLSTFYTKTDKVCNQANSNPLTYTGFKIHREYIVNGLKSPIIHFNSISHCDHGMVDFERVIRVNRDTDIEFNKPFCLLKPSYLGTNALQNSAEIGDLKFDKGRLGGTIIRRQQGEPRIYDFKEIQGLSLNDSLDQLDDGSTLDSFSNYGAKKYLMDFAQGLFAKMTSSKKIAEYIGRRKFLTLTDFEILTPDQLALIDFEDDLVCYNMVRRKKYAKRDMGIYAPFRFIGGIFECSITPQDKIEVLESYKKSLQTPVLKCDPNMSQPIAPLISDDISKQWFQISTGAHIMQRIPYLYTPTSLDPRFHHSNGVVTDEWFTQLDVNEDYLYQPLEIGIITRAITDTSNIVYKMLLSMEEKLMSQKDHNDLAVKMIKNLESNFLTLIGLENETDLLQKLESIEQRWDLIDV